MRNDLALCLLSLLELVVLEEKDKATELSSSLTICSTSSIVGCELILTRSQIVFNKIETVWGYWVESI